MEGSIELYLEGTRKNELPMPVARHQPQRRHLIAPNRGFVMYEIVR